VSDGFELIKIYHGDVETRQNAWQKKPPAGKSRGRLAEALAISGWTDRVPAIRLNRRHAPEVVTFS
jgi:hypothetical protein